MSAKVKAHEKTHLAVLGGAAASGIAYTYVTGPDGGQYAVGGSVKVDLEPVPGDPEATIRKARRIRLAALAVGDPSPADMRVAARAYRMEQQALRTISEERRAEREEEDRDDRAADVRAGGLNRPSAREDAPRSAAVSPDSGAEVPVPRAEDTPPGSIIDFSV